MLYLMVLLKVVLSRKEIVDVPDFDLVSVFKKLINIPQMLLL
jgi:hypothetical protein